MGRAGALQHLKERAGLGALGCPEGAGAWGCGLGHLEAHVCDPRILQ